MYHLIDRIYEAAFVPDMWPIALDDLAMSGSVGGALLVASEAHPPRFAALASIANALRELSSGDAWRNNDRPMRWRPSLDGFLRDIDLLSPEDLEADPMRDELVKYGLGWQAGNDHAMTNGEVVVYSVERCFQDGRTTVSPSPRSKMATFPISRSEACNSDSLLQLVVHRL